MRRRGGRSAGTSRSWLGLATLTAWCALPLLVWAVTGPVPVTERFSDRTAVLRNLGLAAALAGFSAWAANVVLGARLGVVERAWDGLDHLYRAHRRTGEAVVGLLGLHGSLLVASSESLVYLSPARGGWPVFTGVLVFIGLALLVGVSVAGRLHHDLFVKVQRVLGGLLLVAWLHVFRVPGDRAGSAPLQWVLVAYAAVAAAAWTYRSVLGSRAAPRHHYRVAAMRPLTDRITEVVLDPVDHPLTFVPGQFAFLSLGRPAHDTRPHPFSITSDVGDPQVRFVVKGVGDHTRELATIPPGTSARVEGPYGGLCHSRMRSRRQVWIGGGIGITPFIAMARAVSRGGEYDVDLYYCTADRAELVFADELHRHVRVIEVPEDPDGLITAERIAVESGDLADDRDFLICGPPAMLRSLRLQLQSAGVAPDRIHAEDFSFRREGR